MAKVSVTSSTPDNWVLQAFDEFGPNGVGRPRRYKRQTNLKTFLLLLIAGLAIGLGGAMLGFSLNSVHQSSIKREPIKEAGLKNNVPALRQGEPH